MTTEPVELEAIQPAAPGDQTAVVIVERSGCRAVVTLHGDLDLDVEAEVIRTITDAAALRGLAAVHIDTTNVTFIDSSGLRSLLLSRRAVLDRGLQFSLFCIKGGPVARLLVLAGIGLELAVETV